MCGIAGIFHPGGAPVDRDALAAMAAVMVHRGPDGDGVWTDGAVGFSHRRLAVIDLDTGAQPMTTPDGRLTVVFNGEIYNFRRLRAQLEGRGAVFRTRSDTEVLLHLYAAEGVAMFERLEGMFALGLWDAARQELILARDRLGKKPLFYAQHAGVFAFASELQALRRVPGLRFEVRPEAVREFLCYQYVPCPGTIWRDVYKLPPGCLLRLGRGAAAPPEPKRWWRLDFTEGHSFSLKDAAADLRGRLEQAVADRLVADVPLGAFLSGGVDSTCVAGLMARQSDRPVETFTIGFGEREYDERVPARLAAATHGCHHHERVVEPPGVNELAVLAGHAGEPYGDASILPTFLLSRFTRERVTVALSGDGADELFGGYERYQALQLLALLDRVPGSARAPQVAALLHRLSPAAGERTLRGRLLRFLKLLHVPHGRRYFELLCRIPAPLRLELPGPRVETARNQDPADYLDACFAAASCADPLARPSEVDLHSYLLNDILTKVDTASMAASLEVRSPFLDRRVVEFAAALPWTYKQTLFLRKRILLTACADLIPPAIRRRRKKGFGVPLARWLRQGWHQTAREIILDPRTRRAGFFAPATCERVLAEHAAGRADHSYALWAVLMFDLWAAAAGVLGE